MREGEEDECSVVQVGRYRGGRRAGLSKRITRLVGKVELCPNDAAITGKGKREAFAAASWRMLELEIRLKTR